MRFGASINNDMPMYLSKAGEAFIQKEEGVRLKAYQDGAGVWTIGYGNTEGVKPGMTITEEQARVMFHHAIIPRERALNELLKVKVNQNQFDAMISLMYNIGNKAFADSTLLKLVNAGKFEEAANAFNSWVNITVRGVKTISRGLVLRRGRERELFLKEPEKMLSKINEFINAYVVRTIIERVPFLNRLFKYLDGNKTKIGRAGLALTVFLQSLIEFFPQESIVGRGLVFTIGAVSWVLTELGIRHAEDKEVRGIDEEK